MYSSVGLGSDEGQLNIREQESGGGDERACVWWWQRWWYRRGMLVTGSPAPGRKEVCGWQAGRLKGSVAVVAPTAVWWRRLLRYYGPVRMLSSGEGSGKASFHAGSASDLDLPDEQPRDSQ